jgi:hypothetical protein
MPSYAYGACVLCDETFGFNPDYVPTLYGRPVCEPCMVRINAARTAEHMPPVHVSADAYRLAE